RSRISSVTFFLKKEDSPRSPRRSCPSQMRNCCVMGRSRPSRARIWATCSDVALSPAMMAAGSPAVRRSRRKTKSATTVITGMVAKQPAGNVGAHGLAGLLLDVPEHGHWRWYHPIDVLEHRGRLKPLAKRDVRWVLGGPHLSGLGDSFELHRVRLAGVLVTETLDFRVAWPTKHGLVAASV